MAQISMGKTGLTLEQNSFGALPIQRIPMEDAVYLLRKAFDGGMQFYDTARAYSDSEEKMGNALSGLRDKIVIATKTTARTAENFRTDLETSLRVLKTDYIDIYQLHNPDFCPRPGDASGLYDAMLQAKQQGKIRFIGITNHRPDVAREAIESELYDTLQFPFSYLSSETDLALAESCREKQIGLIAMKALSGGLITNAKAACAWMSCFDHIFPIWGVQRERELDDFLSFIPVSPDMDDEIKKCIENDQKELQGNFCRGCGYCTPCPQGITINMCARASLLLRRAPSENMLSDSGQAMMRKVEDCLECGLCASRCPYNLDPPALLKKNYQDYKEVLAGKPI